MTRRFKSHVPPEKPIMKRSMNRPRKPHVTGGRLAVVRFGFHGRLRSMDSVHCTLNERQSDERDEKLVWSNELSAVPVRAASRLANARPLIVTPSRRVVGNRQGFRFKKFKRDLLGQQDVANDEIAHWEKTTLADARAVGVKLLDVHYFAVPYAIAMARLAADHVEITMLLILS